MEIKKKFATAKKFANILFSLFFPSMEFRYDHYSAYCKFTIEDDLSLTFRVKHPCCVAEERMRISKASLDKLEKLGKKSHKHGFRIELDDEVLFWYGRDGMCSFNTDWYMGFIHEGSKRPQFRILFSVQKPNNDEFASVLTSLFEFFKNANANHNAASTKLASACAPTP